MSDLHQLRRRGQRLLATLDLPPRLTITSLAERVAALRGRPLVLDDMLDSTGPTGVWVLGDRRDYVFCDPSLTGMHRAHTQAHEFAHMLLGHGSLHDPKVAFARLKAPDLDDDTILMILSRDFYTDAQEREAEVVASLLYRRINLAEQEVDDLADGGEPDAAVSRLTEALGRRERPRQ